MAKNIKRKPKVKVKVYNVDMNVNITDLNDELLYFSLDNDQREEYQEAIDEWRATSADQNVSRPKLVREKMDGAEFFKDIIMKAISMTHATGNTGSLRRTKSVSDILDHAIEEKDGLLEVMEEDFKYMNSSLNKADKWNNTEDTAKGILLVADALIEAENEHAKSPSSNEDIENEDGDEVDGK